jgi:hypothetical protein
MKRFSLLIASFSLLLYASAFAQETFPALETQHLLPGFITEISPTETMRATLPETLPETRSSETQPETFPETAQTQPAHTPDTFTGLLKRQRLVTSGRPIELHEWMTIGKWRTEGDRIFLTEGTGKIFFRFKASQVKVILKAEGELPLTAKITLNGQPIEPTQEGPDAKTSTVNFKDQRTYDLIHLPDTREAVIEIEFTAPAAGVYEFLFS